MKAKPARKKSFNARWTSFFNNYELIQRYLPATISFMERIAAKKIAPSFRVSLSYQNFQQPGKNAPDSDMIFRQRQS